MSEKLPAGIDSFLHNAGWGAAAIDPIPGDASFRRYFRIAEQGRNAMLMFAPPPEEDPQPFLHVANWLADNKMRAPQIYAEDAGQGWVLIEDFGDDRMRDWLDANPQGETGAYTRAVDALVQLHTKPAGPFASYDMESTAVRQRCSPSGTVRQRKSMSMRMDICGPGTRRWLRCLPGCAPASRQR